MGKEYNDDGIRNLLFAIALDAYKDLVECCRAVIKAKERGLTKDLNEAIEKRDRALEWWEGTSFYDRILPAAEHEATLPRKNIKKHYTREKIETK